jgi:hypothetical protein
MKNLILLSPVILSMLFIMQACSKSKSDVSQPVGNNVTTNPSTDLVIGQWVVQSFAQRTEDKTGMFDGYLFTFVSGGTVKAEKNGEVSQGTWSYSKSVTYYGATPSKSSFTINFGTANPLGLLTKTWNIDSTKTNSTTLALISPEVVENLHVTFSRN